MAADFSSVFFFLNFSAMQTDAPERIKFEHNDYRAHSKNPKPENGIEVSEQALRDRQEPDWTVKNASDKFSLTTGFS